ncbi:MAG: hypothetical protein GY835_23890 [bacterium]|nr:hypothetical protein [bacterium]
MGSLGAYRQMPAMGAEYGWNISEDTAVGFKLINDTLAVTGAGNDQYSPAFIWGGTAYDSNDSVSRDMQFRAYLRTVSGNTPTSQLWFEYRTDTGSWGECVQFNSYGSVTIENVATAAYLRSGTSNSFTMIQNNNRSTGLGVCDTIYSAADVPLMLLREGRTPDDGKRAMVSCWNVATSTINEDSVIHDFGWTNDSDAFTSVFAVYPLHVALPAMTVATAPSSGVSDGCMAYCSDGATGSPCIAVYENSQWNASLAVGSTAIASS